jgi:glycosyltransferase involved in cell wall biosynthesis
MAEVTVLMSVYNVMPYLPEAVDSILKQTLQDFKFLIINDGSTDRTEDYLNRLTDQRIQVVHQSNHGQGAALNRGIAMCETGFLARMDSDDISLPFRLEAQLNYLLANKDVGLVGTQIAYFTAAGQSGFSPPLACEHEAIYADLLRGVHSMDHPSIMCRTSVIKDISGYRVDRVGQDWDMFLRMGEASRLANLNKVLHLYRIHDGSVNARHQLKIKTQHVYSCLCAKRRAQGQPEITFEEFVAEQRARPFSQRLAEVLDVYAFSQYRRALSEILSQHWVRGYVRLTWAALCYPRRTSQRIARAIRKVRKRLLAAELANTLPGT